MTGFVIVGAVGLVVMVGCFVAVIHTARREVERLRAMIGVQAAENASLRKRLVAAWAYANAPEET